MDQAQKVTNQELKKMENHLKKVYSQAKRDVGREWYKYMESIKPKADELLKAYEDAKLTGDKDLIKETGKEYGQFLRQQTYMNEKYKSMLDTTTTKLANVNEIALSYLNNEMPKVYVTNYNQLSKDMPAGISFSLVDETTVKNLVKDNPKLLPTKKLDIPKDKRWNQKAINAQVLQGIIQGESIPEMAKRLTPIMDRNKTSAIRNARTMTTSAQNKGRLDSYKAAQDNGVVLHKVWMATNSDRTRAWHAALNGVEVDIDEPFENDYGEIMFPGDPDADPGNVYNCRCTMTTKIIGFKRDDGSIKYIDDEELKDADEVVEEEEPVETTPKESIKESLMEAYENHRITNNMTSTPAEEIKDFFKVSLPKMSEDSEKALAEQLSSLTSRYDSTVRTIRQMDKMEYVGHINSFATTYHDYETDYSEIMLNPAKYGDVERIKELINKGYSPKIKEEFADRYIITHEFAHTLVDMETELNSKRNWVNADYKKIKEARKEIKSVYDKYVGEVGELEKEKKKVELEAMTSMDEASWKKASDLSSELQKKSVSKYALTNSDEFMAECFAHHELGGPQNSYVDEMMQILNKYFGRK